ncbi:Cytochrome P450 61 [Colletotrichum higginsianum]|uniref:Cytochrome P450 61 n=1 Tax=Colletotrichum higginsianum TaxID=80884 RepID=A0A4T0WFL9_9PEZI|nr:Cytochrome P450 61 [Colletotrichum higginsianum]
MLPYLADTLFTNHVPQNEKGPPLVRHSRSRPWVPVSRPCTQSLRNISHNGRSGPLSCVSVIHKFVVLASGRDIAHKAFESPAYAEPCIVPIAKGIFGGYISQNAVKKIADDFYLVTAFFKLVNVPPSVYVPYTKVWRGRRVADAVHAEFAK